MAMPVKHKKRGIAGLMRDDKLIRRGSISPAIQSNLGSEEIEHLQDEIRNLKMQIEILQEAMKIIKKRTRHQRHKPQQQGKETDR